MTPPTTHAIALPRWSTPSGEREALAGGPKETEGTLRSGSTRHYFFRVFRLSDPRTGTQGNRRKALDGAPAPFSKCGSKKARRPATRSVRIVGTSSSRTTTSPIAGTRSYGSWWAANGGASGGMRFPRIRHRSASAYMQPGRTRYLTRARHPPYDF
jgi:hypothetical protein